jgi:DNA/RNA endonuclease G (NUC1)
MISDVAGAVRAAISHRSNTPDLYTIMSILGKDKVKVPTAFFKIYYDVNTKELLVLVIPHKKETAELLTFKTTLKELELELGFPLHNEKMNDAIEWKLR